MFEIVQESLYEGHGHIHFVEVVSDTPAAKVYRVRAGKWPRVRMTDEKKDYPMQTPETPDYQRWQFGEATMVLSLEEDDKSESGTVRFFDEDAGCEWLVTAWKRCVWVVLLRNAPRRFTGCE